MTTIVKASSEHEAVLISLLGRVTFTETFGMLFSDQNDLLAYLEKTFNVPKIKSSLKNPNNVYFLAYINDLPVGYAKLKVNSPSQFLDKDSVCQLQKIYVLQDFLAQKVGFALQDALLNEAKQLGREHVWLSVLEENERAIRFYIKNGFHLVGKHDFQIGKEHFTFRVMTKPL